ncbi:hypothetical protein [Streptomyces scopuliridis]|uniref:hypothetical protein n=1 Tax=Streptomyces scopuliridis TaxID=452529 RepID=UPI00341504E8
MEYRTEGRYEEFAPLSRSAAWRIATRQTLPSSVWILQAFLVASEVPERAFPDWVAAWTRVSGREKRVAVQRKTVAKAAEGRKATRVTAAGAREWLTLVRGLCENRDCGLAATRLPGAETVPEDPIAHSELAVLTRRYEDAAQKNDREFGIVKSDLTALRLQVGNLDQKVSTLDQKVDGMAAKLDSFISEQRALNATLVELLSTLAGKNPDNS